MSPGGCGHKCEGYTINAPWQESLFVDSITQGLCHGGLICMYIMTRTIFTLYSKTHRTSREQIKRWVYCKLLVVSNTACHTAGGDIIINGHQGNILYNVCVLYRNRCLLPRKHELRIALFLRVEMRRSYQTTYQYLYWHVCQHIDRLVYNRLYC